MLYNNAKEWEPGQKYALFNQRNQKYEATICFLNLGARSKNFKAWLEDTEFAQVKKLCLSTPLIKSTSLNSRSL